MSSIVDSHFLGYGLIFHVVLCVGARSVGGEVNKTRDDFPRTLTSPSIQHVSDLGAVKSHTTLLSLTKLSALKSKEQNVDD